MPFLSGLLASLFAKIFEFFGTRFSYGLAFGLAVSASSLVAIAALKAALSGVWSLISLAAPTVVTDAFTMVMPGNFSWCLSSIIIIDVIGASYDYWRQTAGLVIAGTKA